MTRWAGLALFLLMAALFLIANRGAYKGYFQDDELDSLSWTTELNVADFARALVTPRVLKFRPADHFYFHVMSSRFDLDFRKYLIPIHALHFFNVWLVWSLARKLAATPFAAAASGLFFAFHMAAFDAYWKPMYIVDVLCVAFCLLSLLLYAKRHWVLSFFAFWLAYKSKELAVMLPAVLACYELWFGKKHWKPLFPFLLVSLWFGLQGLLLHLHQHTGYGLGITAGSVFRTSRFYASSVLLFPFAGFVLPFVPLMARDRRVWFGLAAMFLFFFPLAFLPGRLIAAYCYLPLAGLALAVAGIADPSAGPEHSGLNRRLLVVVFFLFWIPWNMLHLRLNRRHVLAVDDENREYVATLRDFARSSPQTQNFVYDGRPFAFRPWGIAGALRYFYHRADIQAPGIEDPEARAALQSASVAVLNWDPLTRKLSIASRTPDTPDAPYIRMDRLTPIWQLDQGWYGLEGGLRWIQPTATAHLRRPEDARRFELRVNIAPDLLRQIGHTETQVLLDGRLAGSYRFTREGWQTVRWGLPPSSPGPSQVEFRVAPHFRPSADPRPLGVAIGAFGFLPKE